MMKLYQSVSVMITSLLFILIGLDNVPCVFATLVNGSLYVRFIINNGKSIDGLCTPEDVIQINNAFPTNMQPSRHLRRNNGITKDDVQSNTTRELYPPVCASLCQGQVPGSCRATRCVGYRRNLQFNIIPVGSVGEICAIISQKLHERVDGLIQLNKVSSTCQKALSFSGRNATCVFC